MRRAAIFCAALASLLVTCGSAYSLFSPSSPSTPADAVARGEHAYRVAGCASCHETSSSGQRTAPALDHIGSVAAARRPGMRADEYIRESILDPEAYFVAGYEGFASRGFDRPIPSADLDALVAYLVSLK